MTFDARPWVTVIGAASIVALTASGCSPTAEPSPEREPLPHGVIADYQLGGGYPPPDGIGAVVRDATDEPETGLYSICYVNGFQTQPADRAEWLADHPDLVVMTESGPLVDEGWPDELILDTSSVGNRDRIAEIMTPVIERCAESGFAAVEFDNLDSFLRSDDQLTADDAISLATRLVDVAHSLGLSAAQKNAVELAARAKQDAGFDFAIVEQCLEFDECSVQEAVYGASVIDVEYLGATEFAEACAASEHPLSTIRRDRELSTPDSAGYVFDTC